MEGHKCADYAIAWIAPLPVELAAAKAMLDDRKQKPPKDFAKNKDDTNSYTFGRIGEHNIVIASLRSGAHGIASAAVTAKGLRSSFPHVRFGLLVGIGAGIPGEQVVNDKITVKRDIRLGDVVVGNPDVTNGGVVQYDFVKAKRYLERKGFLDSPPTALQSAIANMQSEHILEGSKISETVASYIDNHPKAAEHFSLPAVTSDRLFQSTYAHIPGDSCQGCSETQEIPRLPRRTPKIHYGTIASGNTLVKNAEHRDKLVKSLMDERVDPICFEMEAAGLLEAFPCLVIRGVSDYADSHKNDSWQGYAAMNAAALAKELLGFVDVQEVDSLPGLEEVLATQAAIIHQITESTLATQKVQHTLEEQQVFQWLRAPDPSVNHNKARQLYHRGTGQWLLDSEDFHFWEQTAGSFLWLNGMAGCGKTVLSSTVIQYLRDRPESAGIVLYFYFDFSDTSKQSMDSAIRSLVSQICFVSKGDSSAAACLWRACHNGSQQPSSQQLCELLRHSVRLSGDVTIVLDALDECGQPEQRRKSGVLSWLESLTKMEAKIHLLVTSRREPDIKTALMSWARGQDDISLETDKVASDIESYVQAAVNGHGPLGRWRDKPEVKALIVETLIQGANGMFRWVQCQLNTIEGCLDLPRLKNALCTLPKNLDETYQRIISNIPESNLDSAVRLLRLMVYSKRPLRLEEAIDAIAVSVEAENSGFDPEDRLPDPDEIVALCPSLVGVVDVTEVKWGDKGKIVTVHKELRLVHFSVREYLTSKHQSTSPRLSFHSEPCVAHIGSVLLTYLLHLPLDLHVKVLQKKYPLARYCAIYWPSFFNLSDSRESTFSSLAMKLFSTGWHSRAILYLHLNSILPEDILPKRLSTPLHFVARNGCTQLVATLLEKGADVNARTYEDYEVQTVLYTAVMYGHKAVVALLLDSGAYVDDEGGRYGNALQAAAYRGYEAIVALLLYRGADVNAIGGQYGSALQAAAWSGNETVLALLLDRGAHVNAEGGAYGNALQAAAYRGCEAVAALLLDRGANVNAVGGDYGSALQAAALSGSKTIAALLLAKGANVNAIGGEFGSALQAAAYCLCEAVVALLLDRGADVNAKGGTYGSALQAAATHGGEAVVALLIERGADVNAEGGMYGSALQAAACSGSEAVVALLLKRGANLYAKGRNYESALEAAAGGGNLELVKLFLADGEDTIAQRERLGSALSNPTQWDDEKTVALLQDETGDTKRKDWNSELGRSLKAAAKRGNSAVVALLLERGADVHWRGDDDSTVLEAASEWGGDEATFAILLDRIVDVEKCYYDRALALAADQGQLAQVALLLGKGADPNAKSREHGNALRAAAAEGWEDVMALLLENGAHVDVVAIATAGAKSYRTRIFRAQYTRLLEMLLLKMAEQLEDGSILSSHD